ncbi:MAG: hypothetical protein AAF628_26505 [Planctomycetota bacterium]
MLASCAAPPPPPASPLAGLRAAVRHYAGTVISGPTPAAIDGVVDEPAGAVPTARLEIWQLPDGVVPSAWHAALAPLAELAELVARTADGAEFGITRGPLGGVRAASGARAESLAETLTAAGGAQLALAEAPLLAGATAAFVAEPNGGAAGLTRAELRVGRDVSGALRVALVTDRIVDGESVALLDAAVLASGQPLALLAPTLGAAAPGTPSLAVVLRVTPPPTAGDDATAAHAHSARVAAAREAITTPAPTEPDTATQASVRSVAAAAAALPWRARRRGALVWLAEACDADCTGDAALAADDDALAQLATTITPILPSEATAPSPALGLQLEHATMALLAEQQDAGNLPTELEAVLLRHLGGAGRFAATLLASLRRAADLPALHALVAQENQLLLEDGDPAVRVRAFDWLATQGLAPAGFDPLADRRTRRRALRAAERAKAQAAAEAQRESER